MMKYETNQMIIHMIALYNDFDFILIEICQSSHYHNTKMANKMIACMKYGTCNFRHE